MVCKQEIADEETAWTESRTRKEIMKRKKVEENKQTNINSESEKNMQLEKGVQDDREGISFEFCGFNEAGT